MESTLLDLPLPLLWVIIGKLTNWIDVVSVFQSCSNLRKACQDAPLSLHIKPDVPAGRTSGRKTRELTVRELLKGISETFKSVTELDLRGCLVLDGDIVYLLEHLPELKSLNLGGCQKLTVGTAHVVNSSSGCGRGLRVLNLQRCFRMVDHSLPLKQLLTGVEVPGRCLKALLLSHIPSLDSMRALLNPEESIPLPEGHGALEASPVPCVADPPAALPTMLLENRRHFGRSLHVLALHNCGKIQPEHLTALALACGELEILCLGGSIGNCQKAEEMADAFMKLERLRVLELTFWGGQGACVSGQAPHTASSGPSICEIIRAAFSNKRPQGHVRVWDLCDPWDTDAAHAWVRNQASAQEKLALTAASNCSDARRRTPLHVAASKGEVASVVHLLALGATAGGEGATAGDGPRDVGGATALFLAAENGHANCVEALIRGGANILASNRGNESPLYIASLKGYVDVVAVMLQHCRERGLKWQDAGRYGDGWTPLMAAAVANRQDVALLLLQAACGESAIEPPMLLPPGEPSFVSTTVLARETKRKPGVGSHSHSRKMKDDRGGGQMVSTNPIAQAGPTKALNVGSIPLLDARNRYGSTALHIGAMKSLRWFTFNLLTAGADWQIRDSYGLTPQQVAAKLGHKDIEQILRKWDAEATSPLADGLQAMGRQRKERARSRKVPSQGDSQRAA